MSNKRKRGTAKCKKKFLNPDQFKIEFDKNGLAKGENKSFFMSWVGLEFRKQIPYHKVVKDIDPKLYDDIWEYTKRSNIGIILLQMCQNKSLMKRVKKPATVQKKNVNPARVGRGGFSGMEASFESRWNQLISSYPQLAVIQDERSKRYDVSRARLNRITNLYEFDATLQSNGVLIGILKELHSKEKEIRTSGSYYEYEKDVVTEVVGKGCHHGGRTRLVSNVIGATQGLFSRKKRKSNKDQRLQEQIKVVQQNHYHVDTEAEASLEIKSIIGCELTWPFDDSCLDLVLAGGRVYPTSQRILHGHPIYDGFVKVQVDFVNENCTRFPILPQTRTDEVNEMADTQGQFIQWPRKAIKLLNTESLQEPIALNQQAPQHSSEYRPLMLNGELLIQSTHTEDVIDNQTSCIKDVPHPQTTHAKNISAPKPTEILPDPKKVAPILTLAKSKASKIYRLVEKLAHVYAQTSTINVTSPHGMYMVDYHENVDVESMMRLCVNGWVDVGVLHLYTMYLYAFGGFKGFHKTTYFNPRVVELGVCNTDPNFVINYIKSVMEHHKDKQYFMAPYSSGSHWSLIMIHRNLKDNKFYGSIIDSINKGNDAQCYPIVDIFKKAIRKNISWHMVNCYQQSETWECGYYIMKAMYDFVICCKEHLMMHNNRPLLQDEIDEFIEHTLENFMIIFGQ
ncbi:hypothetical protein R6Q57_024079 [Mikania cordata]